MATRPATVPLLHRFLGIGLVMLAGTFLVLAYLGIAPLLPPTDGRPVIAYALAAAGVLPVALALLVFKPRVPERRGGQPVEDYWSTPDVAAKALLVWFLMEGGAMLATIGFLLTGEPVSAIVMGVTVVAYWLCGPNVFAKA
jgi:hypothetical protein